MPRGQPRGVGQPDGRPDGHHDLLPPAGREQARRSGASSCPTTRSGAPAPTRTPRSRSRRPVTVGGKTLPAGTYGLHMMPDREGLVRHPEHGLHRLGQLQLRREGGRRPLHGHAEAGRLRGAPRVPLREPDRHLGRRRPALGEARRSRFPITVDTKAVVIASLKKQLRGPAALRLAGLEPGRPVVPAARRRSRPGARRGPTSRSRPQTTFANLRTKAAILEKKGDAKAAEDLRAQAHEDRDRSRHQRLRLPAPRAEEDRRGDRGLPQERQGPPDSWNATTAWARRSRPRATRRRADRELHARRSR